MKTLNSFISEATRSTGGRFKNSGSDALPLIKEFIKNCMVDQAGRSLQGEFDGAITFDGSSYVLDINMLSKFTGVSVKEVTVRIINENMHLTKACELFTTKGEVSRVQFRGNSIDDGPGDVELRMVKHAFPTAGGSVDIRVCPITTLKDCPRPSGNIERFGKKNRNLNVSQTRITDLSGCPDCEELVLANNPYLKSLAGSKIRILKYLDVSRCPSLKSLKGTPRMDKDIKRLVLNYNEGLNLKDLPSILPGNCNINEFFVDGDPLMKAKCNLDGVNIVRLNIYYNKSGNITINPKLVDILPPNISGAVTIFTDRCKATNKDNIKQMLHQRYPHMGNVDILIRAI